ncbi:hypothetical protein BJ875DRAFT_74427 [Amylocarpus encephaloides]|uniref:U3 small nucleolar RNA-associated protein 10 n=1 Tax=Amylocarpus encephaloides TaxID=45428 RepID=A0A9P7YF94_9HELO|nr:hypothetical protein BJ875DRAFT_74427 [Amylocarpus encephaloides]
MATTLAAQLSQIAANSTNSLNLKAQKAAHSKSLIFEPRVAASQSFNTLYNLCHEGFQELCLLDRRFLEFQRNIFNERSQDQDRTQMTEAENEKLNQRLESFLGLVGGRVRLTPGAKAVEWLVRRFRIHEYNTHFLLTTFLPYHTLPIFSTLMSILPSRIPSEYKFLEPYIRSLTPPPRHAIVKAAINAPTFTTSLNSYVIRVSRSQQHYPALLAFWAGVMTEAVGGMMDKSRSGRKGVQHDNEQNVILRMLPTLNAGLGMKHNRDLRIGCYMLLSVMASKGGLDDKILVAMMEAVVLGWEFDTITSGLVCLSMLTQQRGSKRLPRKVTKELTKIEGLPTLLLQLSKQRRVDKLAYGLSLALIERLKKKSNLHALSDIQEIIQDQLLSDVQVSVVVKALLLTAHQIDDNLNQITLRPLLASTLVALTQFSSHTGDVVRSTLGDTDVDIDELEMKLQTTIRQIGVTGQQTEDEVMEESEHAAAMIGLNFQTLLEKVSQRTTTETSFLTHNVSYIYPDLCRAFLASTSSQNNLSTFDASPILGRESALEDSLYLTFYIKTWCGPYPVLARTSALHMAAQFLSKSKTSKTDVQAILPYALSALSDPAAKIRRAAAELVISIDHLYPTGAQSKKDIKNLRKWAAKDLYGTAQEQKDIEWLSPDIAMRLLKDHLLPSLEECILDAKHIQVVFQKTLQNQSSSEALNKTESTRLPQAARTSILNFFASHIIQTPLFVVKLRLLECLNQIRGVATLSRTKVLLPILQYWVSLTAAEVSECCQHEQISQDEFDEQSLLIVTPNDEDGILYLCKIVTQEVAIDRPALLTVSFQRLRMMWSSLKEDSRLNVARTLMDVSLSTAEKHADLASQMSSEFLSAMTLSTDILQSFLDQLPTAAKLVDMAPTTKRRRTSHGEVARSVLHDPKQLSDAIQKVTFVLQLVDNSNPGSHPELLRGLFAVLGEIQHFKAQVASELAYLQGLVLSSLLAILKAHRLGSGTTFDRSAVRADLLVDCVQKTSSPQVQNAALLLIAALAEIAPELVLHSVMPIFTFMGHSVLRQNDDYSAYVISQTIREVIPPLISSLRKGKSNIVVGASELLLSFVAAYEHVPSHRRKGLYTSLIQTLGPDDFLFAFLAMLVNKYGATENVKQFAVELSSSFNVGVQLQSLASYLDLIKDLLKPKPTYSSILLNSNEDGPSTPSDIASAALELLPAILSQKRLIAQTGQLLEKDDMDAARVRDLYSMLLENLLGLADNVREQNELHSSCGDILEALLGLLSTSEFVKSVEQLLDRPNESLRRKILRSLQVRIDQESPSDVLSRTAMLAFLPQLTAIIRESKDTLYKHTAVACIDKISEKYGKKDLEAVSAAAETIASSHCLGQSDDRLRVMALLCLASLVEILREGVVSVLPSAIPKALEYMELSLEVESEAQQLHNAGYAFISALAQHLPYMISGAYLAKLLQISNVSSETDLGDDADESRIECLQLCAKQLDAKSLFTTLEKNWDSASSKGPIAIREYVEILNIAIEKHPKTTVTKYAAILAKIFQNAFDLRRQQAALEDGFDIETVAELESEINEVTIKMVYKFNDATFRPIFANLVEWASSSLPKGDKTGKDLRLQSLYGFVTVFFDKLKSIVTSYATYLLENAVDVLNNVDPKDVESRELWSKVLQTLVRSFRHDQDDFWQSPAHFSAIAPVLCAQFNSSLSLPLSEDLIPAVVELAAAADSSEHHKELNGTILKHLRSEVSGVRLAAVKCQQAITGRLGEEWLAMLPEMLPFISELQEDDDDVVERETHRWIVEIEKVLGESLDSMLQ